MKVETYLPIFTGYYCNAMWSTESDEQAELDDINVIRSEKGWKEITWDDLKFEYNEHHTELAKKITDAVEEKLDPYVKSIEFQKLVSPRYYNYSNDSINCIIEVDDDLVMKYLDDNMDEFKDYLKEKYTSCSGFISSYPNKAGEFLLEKPLEHKHKLGSILQFIASNEEISEFDLEVCDNYLSATNYNELIENEIIE